MTSIKSESKKEIIPNNEQKFCIENIKGKYLVLAGPGTGKTFTVIERIINMIKNEVEPSKILCLTFTDAAANEMRKRLEEKLEKLAIEVNVFTYHSFCINLIEENKEIFELPSNYKVISETTTRAFVKDCIDEIEPKYYRTDKNDPYYYIDEIKSRIEDIKKYRLNKEQFFNNLKENKDYEPKITEIEQIIKDVEEGKNKRYKKPPYDKLEQQHKKINKMEELWQFYELYSKKMEERHYLDFSDMINFVLDKFETDSDFLDYVSKKYEYVLVDEYQDTNKAQNDIVFNLVKNLESQNIFVVGDDDQIIYSFQGAKLDTIENFLNNFSDTKVICLKENMRSTQNILDFARELVIQDERRLESNPKFNKYKIDKELISANPNLKDKNKPAQFINYNDALQEQNEIIKNIENIINSQTCPVDKQGNKKLSEIAILTKTNKELDSYAELLKNKNIPYELKEGKNIFEINCVNITYSYLQMLVNPEKYATKFAEFMLTKPFSINTEDFVLIKKNNSLYKNFIENLKNIDKNSFKDYKKIDNFIKTYEYLLNYKNKENIKNVVLEVINKTGILEYYLNDEINRTENIAGLKTLIDTISEYSNIYQSCYLEEFINYLELLQNDDIPINTPKAPTTLNAVQLCTYYASKGREFEYVFMPNLVAKSWESNSKSSLKPQIPLAEYKTDDEWKKDKYSDLIKVLYVGITRAKHFLQLSKPNDKTITKFISNIDREKFKSLAESTTMEEYNENSYWNECANVLIKRNYDYDNEFKELIKSKLSSKKFSPSAINKYLKCPRQYFYEKILDLNIEGEVANSASYGTAIHYALEKANNYAKENNELCKVEFLIEKFKEKMHDVAFSDYNQRRIYIKRGEEALTAFHKQYLNENPKHFYSTEENINFEIEVENEKYIFNGYIDRVDKTSDNEFVIYDYKTGNSKDGKIICPQGEHEDYYNQMGLYKYFYEKLTGKKVAKTEFIYPEDFEKNYEIKYTSEELECIVEKFKNAIKDIYKCKFEPSYCKDACKYCQYKGFCNTNSI